MNLRERILALPAVQSGDRFRASRLHVSHGADAEDLRTEVRRMVRDGILEQVLTGDVVEYRLVKLRPLLMPWRKRTNAQLGIA